MMSKIPLARQIIYLMLLMFVPLLALSFNYIQKKDRMTRLIARLDENTQKAVLLKMKEKPNKLIRQKFQDKDQFFLAKKLETQMPLENEYTHLVLLTKNRYHPEEDAIKRRIDALTNGQNALSFAELSVKKFSDCTETINCLAHPVEVDTQDLLNILSKIEGSSINGQEADSERPHLIISDFKIERKKGLTSEIYLLNLQLIKREYPQNP